MLVLCSNGLTSSKLLAHLSERIQSGSAALVVTADNVYKENNYHVPRCTQELQRLHLRADIFDIVKQPIEELLKYDVVEFIGGNPYYLLKSLKEHANAKEVLQKIAREKTLIGWSAGAIAMTPTIGIIQAFSPELNQWNVTDLCAMGLTDVQIIPHYSKFSKRYERFEERCVQYEKDNDCALIRLEDGEGIAIAGDAITYIKP